MNASKELKLENKKRFYYKNLDGADVYFTTAEGGENFKLSSQSGKENIEHFREEIGATEIGYLNQTHSDHVYIYDGTVKEGDALITNKSGVAIGVFTADCVPILLYDKEKKVSAAVHSGWKGTYNCILKTTIERMKREYSCNLEDIQVFIGPHIRVCCYETGYELIERFKAHNLYNGYQISKGDHLDLTKCIKIQLESIGIPIENTHDLEKCTLCSSDVKLHSYRKDKENSGRLFSVIYLK